MIALLLHNISQEQFSERTDSILTRLGGKKNVYVYMNWVRGDEFTIGYGFMRVTGSDVLVGRKGKNRSEMSETSVT